MLENVVKPGGAGKRRLILLVLALGMAALAAVLVRTYLAQKAAELEASFADTTEKAVVMVANQNVPTGSRISTEYFSMRKIPLDMIPPDAIAPDDFERAEGQSLTINLPRGRPLLWGYLSSGVNPSFSDMLKEDRRALTIAVDELNSISGMIRPYDRIDLFIITKGEATPNAKDSKVVMPLLQDVLVKATGNIVRRETGTDGREYDRRYSTLTLDLLPDEIGRVLIAQENGELKAALKRPEQSTASYQPTRESDLWAKAEGDGKKDGVDVYIGGKGTGVVQMLFQPYPKDPKDLITGGIESPDGVTVKAQTGIPDDDEMIGGPMTKEQIELIEQELMKRKLTEAEVTNPEANATDSAAPQTINTASAGARKQ
ncbi:MAG: Flp pilus assembly protein CpaB [Azoarcus sp.]|jgi:pilus assembly protein CpaB|nr:Flp pilus assembly protein CpaB [Azoarcus sp.]